MSVIEGLAREYEVTEGSFKLVHIGSERSEVLESLQAMGVSELLPELRDRVAVSNPKDVDQLGSAQRLIAAAGELVVEFKGDMVERIRTGYRRERWTDLLKDAKTREEVYAALRTILSETDQLVIRSSAPDQVRIDMRRITPEARSTLASYDAWRAFHEDEEGHWTLLLVFENDRLRSVRVEHHPVYWE